MPETGNENLSSTQTLLDKGRLEYRFDVNQKQQYEKRCYSENVRNYSQMANIQHHVQVKRDTQTIPR